MRIVTYLRVGLDDPARGRAEAAAVAALRWTSDTIMARLVAVG